MGSVEEHLGVNATSIASLLYLWRSPRGTLLRIEALALVAIILSFFLALFGSCRRWSNLWVVQKGFLAAQVLSLSLGTYSIGLMQSSPVKSEMYPIWAVSLLTLFGCIDPVTTYTELDYKGLLSKMIFQLCLYFGYVMMMSVSTISSHVGKIAIVLLSTISFSKGFHRALAFVLPGKIREDIATQGHHQAIELYAFNGGDNGRLIVHYSTNSITTMADIKALLEMASLPNGTTANSKMMEDITANSKMMEDICLSYSFSHLLRKRFIGLDTTTEMKEKLWEFKEWKRYCAYSTFDCKQAWKVVELELAFLFEAFFTSNEFLHLYQGKIGSFWALASFVGICFVGVVVAIIPEAMAGHHTPAAATGSAGAGTSGEIYIVVTTTADLIVTLVILVSMALLQLVQLIRCWTSNWARVQIACKYASKEKKQMQPDQGQSIVEVTGGDGPNNDDPQRGHGEELCSSSNTRSKNNQISQWMRWLRLFLVARMNWFDKYLWQVRLGQHSVDALLKRRIRTQCCRGSILQKHRTLKEKDWLGICLHWLSVIGVQYFWRLVNVLFLSDSTNSEGAVSLDDDVKASVADFLGTIRSRRIGVEWLAWLPDNGLQCWFPILLPYTYGEWIKTSSLKNESEASFFTRNVIIWHIVTCYCKKAEKEAGGREYSSRSSIREKNRRVAMDLSKYCLYLVVSAPELLPGPATRTKQALDNALDDIQDIRTWGEYVGKLLRNEAATMPLTFPFPASPSTQRSNEEEWDEEEWEESARGACTTDPWKLLQQSTWSPRTQRSNEEEWEQSSRRACTTDPWKLLALLWVQTLVYAAPYGDVQAHMRHLAQGGEFITHLWALLYHLGIDRWKLEDMDKLKAMMEQAAEATWEVQVAEDAFSGSEIEGIN